MSFSVHAMLIAGASRVTSIVKPQASNHIPHLKPIENISLTFNAARWIDSTLIMK